MTDGGSPGPWVDHGRPQCAAEEAASAAIETLLSDGGLLLWQRYLGRKAFTFAAGVATELVLSQAQLAFVAHDTNAAPDLLDGDDLWDLEDEPEPAEVDSWARMRLHVRKPAGPGDGTREGMGVSKAKSMMGMSKSAGALRARTSDTRPRAGTRMGKSEKTETRATPIQEEVAIDEWEEQLRDAKVQEEAKKREKEKKARETEKTREEERRKVQERHEEMSQRAHTFDTEGNIIWVEEIKLDRLPRVQEAFGYAVKKDPKPRAAPLEDTMRSTMTTGSAKEPPPVKDAAAAQKGSRRGRGQRGAGRFDRTSRAEHGEPEFTDGFSKLQHGQPPILETMIVRSGVVLEAMGKKKAGSEAAMDRHVMSRREYTVLAERELAVDYRGGGAVGSGAVDDRAKAGAAGAVQGLLDEQGGYPTPLTSPAAAAAAMARSLGGSTAVPQAGPGAPSAGVGATTGGGTGLLPPLRGAGAGGAGGGAGAGHAGRSAGVGGRGGGRDLDGDKVQRAPPAPPPALRHMGKKFEAMGAIAFQRAPRYHVPQLGGATGYGAAQPPLGATMGHGLVRHGSLKEDYFFPPQMPDLPMAMIRATSEVALGRGQGSARGGPATPKGGTPKGGPRAPGKEGAGGGEDEEAGGGGGMMRPESLSAAYRNFRHQLFPETAATSLGFGPPRF